MLVNGTHITNKLYDEIVIRRRSGAKIFLVTPGETELDTLGRYGVTSCSNCDGAGNIGIQIVVNGPNDDPKTMYQIIQGDAGPQRHSAGCIWHDGHWYNAMTIMDKCPVCEGRGTAARPAMQRESVVASR